MGSNVLVGMMPVLTQEKKVVIRGSPIDLTTRHAVYIISSEVQLEWRLSCLSYVPYSNTAITPSTEELFRNPKCLLEEPHVEKWLCQHVFCLVSKNLSTLIKLIAETVQVKHCERISIFKKPQLV